MDNPIYLFGLVDREEYQISASSDLFEPVQQYVLINNISATVVSTPGCNRLGNKSITSKEQSTTNC